jgi:hypothetical protein
LFGFYSGIIPDYMLLIGRFLITACFFLKQSLFHKKKSDFFKDSSNLESNPSPKIPERFGFSIKSLKLLICPFTTDRAEVLDSSRFA